MGLAALIGGVFHNPSVGVRYLFVFHCICCFGNLLFGIGLSVVRSPAPVYRGPFKHNLVCVRLICEFAVLILDQCLLLR